VIGDEFGMEYLAILLFWSLILALILWLIYTLINNNLNTKPNCRKNKSQNINELHYRRGEKAQKENANNKSKH